MLRFLFLFIYLHVCIYLYDKFIYLIKYSERAQSARVIRERVFGRVVVVVASSQRQSKPFIIYEVRDSSSPHRAYHHKTLTVCVCVYKTMVVLAFIQKIPTTTIFSMSMHYGFSFFFFSLPPVFMYIIYIYSMFFAHTHTYHVFSVLHICVCVWFYQCMYVCIYINCIIICVVVSVCYCGWSDMCAVESF